MVRWLLLGCAVWRRDWGNGSRMVKVGGEGGVCRWIEIPAEGPCGVRKVRLRGLDEAGRLGMSSRQFAVGSTLAIENGASAVEPATGACGPRNPTRKRVPGAGQVDPRLAVISHRVGCGGGGCGGQAILGRCDAGVASDVWGRLAL